MKRLITKEHSHLLFKDEIGDDSLILRCMEIYRKDDTTLKVLCWSPKIFSQLQNEGLISKAFITDEKLHCGLTDNANLPRLFALGGIFKRRPFKHGKWITDKEKRLGHKIIPYNPKLK